MELVYMYDVFQENFKVYILKQKKIGLCVGVFDAEREAIDFINEKEN